MNNLLDNIFERSRINMSNDNYLGIDVLKSLDSDFGNKVDEMSKNTIQEISATDKDVITKIMTEL